MKKIKSNSNHKLIALAIILLLAISIGYALLTTTLSINGTANIASSSWLVYFTNVQVKDGSVTAMQTPTTSGTSTTTLTWAVNLQTPGDFYEYSVDVKNDGTIDAMIGSLSNTSLDINQAKYLNYSVTYNDGAVIEQYDKLNSGGTVKLKVRVEFKTDINPEDLPNEASTVTLTYTSNYVQADENAKDRNRISHIGETVNYATTLNGVSLNNWKIFYEDDDYVTLLYGDYLPNSAIDFTSSGLSGLSPGDSTTYGIYPYSNDRIEFLDILQTKANWSGLLEGTINGNPINYSDSTNTNIWAMGAPTVDLWVNSWNITYPEDKIYIAMTEEEMYDGLKGYYVGLEENPTTYEINYQIIQAKEGYNNALFFPHHNWIEYCYAYWLASPSAYEDTVHYWDKYLMAITCDGYIAEDACQGVYDVAARPVISLPLNLFE